MSKKPITVTATVDAWLTSTSDTLDMVLTKEPKEQVACLGYSNYDMASGSFPWVKIGSAEITVIFLPRDDVVAEQTKILRSELQKERADSQVRQNAILDRISKLQALEFSA